MNGSQSRNALALLGALALGAPALGQQDFNIDIGGNQTYGVPSNLYGAGALQPGTWNDVQTFALVQPLYDLTGTLTNVTFTDWGTGAGNYESDNAGTSGDDEALMDDFTDLGCTVGDQTMYTISGLPDGDYEIYSYGWASDDATFRTDITVTGSPDPLQSVGGPWAGNHALGVTYALHSVTVAGGSTVDILADTSNGCGSVNGFQIVSGGSGGPIGTNYCGPANVNSTGQSAVISAFGRTDVTKNDLTLTAGLLPQNQFGYFLNSDKQGFVPFPPGSSGNLCLAGGIGRHVKQVGNTGTAGELVIPVDLTNMPRPNGGYAVLAGETWNFQCWFRDKVGGNPTSNFTDGIEILFQ